MPGWSLVYACVAEEAGNKELLNYSFILILI
jgi:hypothetical protein